MFKVHKVRLPSTEIKMVIIFVFFMDESMWIGTRSTNIPTVSILNRFKLMGNAELVNLLLIHEPNTSHAGLQHALTLLFRCHLSLASTNMSASVCGWHLTNNIKWHISCWQAQQV